MSANWYIHRDKKDVSRGQNISRQGLIHSNVLIPEEWKVDITLILSANSNTKQVSEIAALNKVQLRPPINADFVKPTWHLYLYGQPNGIKNFLDMFNVEDKHVILKQLAVADQNTEAQWYYTLDDEHNYDELYDDVISNIIEYAYQKNYRYAAWLQREASFRVYFDSMSEVTYNGDYFANMRSAHRYPDATGRMNYKDKQYSQLSSINPLKDNHGGDKFSEHKQKARLPEKLANLANADILSGQFEPEKLQVNAENSYAHNIEHFHEKDITLSLCDTRRSIDKERYEKHSFIANTEHDEAQSLSQPQDITQKSSVAKDSNSVFQYLKDKDTGIAFHSNLKSQENDGIRLKTTEDFRQQDNAHVLAKTQQTVESSGTTIAGDKTSQLLNPDKNSNYLMSDKQNIASVVNMPLENIKKPNIVRPSNRRQKSKDENVSNEQGSNSSSHHLNSKTVTENNDSISENNTYSKPPDSMKSLSETCQNLTFYFSQGHSKEANKVITTVRNPSSSDPEFRKMKTIFFQGIESSAFEITQVHRIINSPLYKEYLARKEKLDARNPSGVINEKYLWHGTSVRHTALGLMPIERINDSGFNRSYCNQSNGAVYGDGVYFAVKAKTAAKYATPDTDGNRYIYYCRVLTGEYTLGKSGIKEPPVKNIQKKEWYDSVVDHMDSPSMFVIFRDTQAYPEYLIIFK